MFAVCGVSDVAGAEEFWQAYEPPAGGGFDFGIRAIALRVEDRAAEPRQQFCHSMADGAEADETDGLFRQHEIVARQATAAPLAALQMQMPERDMAQSRKDQPQREFRDRNGV
jgi:hypothetical protein